MFNWLKRREAPPPADRRSAGPVHAKRAAPASPASHPPSDPAALPEVVAEGNTQADWSAWEDSMTALDSQMQSILPTERVYVRDTRPSRLDDLGDIDPFAGVRSKRER